MKNANLTITLPTGYLAPKPSDKVSTFNASVVEFEAELRQLNQDAEGNDIDVMTVEIADLEKWQYVMRRRRLELGRQGLALVEEREALVNDLLAESANAIAKAEQGLWRSDKLTHPCSFKLTHRRAACNAVRRCWCDCCGP
jgi:hypothetical protein